MKPIFRITIIIVTALLFVSLIGCGEDDEDDKKDDDIALDFVDTTWQIVTINGQKFEEIFKPAEPTEFETEFMLGGNSWTFDTDGSFTGMLEFILTEKYPKPVSSMRQEITIKSEGDYTAAGTTLKITEHDLMVDVTVKLEPKEVWEQQIEGKTVEEFENDLAAETKLGFGPTATGALFKQGTEYTWSLDEDMLTLSVSNQKITLQRASE